MRTRRWWGLLLASAWLGASACAPTPPSSKIEMPVRQFSVANVELPSGLQVIVEDDATARVVASALVVASGAADDPPGQEGMAHLVEHLTFRARRPGQSNFSSWLALHGIGKWNGITEMDLTSYYLVGPPETLSAMIDAEVMRMRSPLEGIDEETFKAERGVVVAELHTRDESGGLSELRHTVFSQLFSVGHPYSRGGSAETLATITLEQARAWAALHYRARNMTWVIAGALDRGEAARLLDQRVPSLLREPDPSPPPRQPLAPPALDPPPPAPATLPVVLGPVSRPTLVVAWKLPPMQGRMEPVLAMLPALVTGEVRADGITSKSTGIASMDDAAVLYLETELEPDAKPEEVWKDMRSHLKDAWGGGDLRHQWFVEGRFGQVRGAAVVGIARRVESIVTRALMRAQRARISHSTGTFAALNQSISMVTYQDVLEAGRGNVTDTQARAVLLRPIAGQATEEERNNPEESGTAFAPEVVRADYPAEVLARFARGPHLTQISTFRASNGLEVVSVPETGTGLVTVTLGIRAGRLTSSPPALADRFAWSSQSWKYERPEWIGASVASWWTDDTGFLEYRGASGNLSNLLAMLCERVLTRYPSHFTRAALARPSPNPELDEFNRRFWEAMLGAPGGKAQLSVAQAAALDEMDARRWYEEVLNPHSAVLVVAGDVKGNLQEEVEHWLGRWHGPEKAPTAALPPTPAAPGVLRVVKATLPHGKQVRVRLGCLATAASLDDELAFRLLADELNRQWTKLERETLGSSYGFESSVQVRRDGSMRMLVFGRVENASARRITIAVAQAWKALGDAAVDDNKLGRLRWDYARDYNVRFLTTETISQDVVRHRLRGRPASAPDDVPAALKRVGREQLAAVAKQCQSSAVYGLFGEATALDVDAQLPKDARVVRP
jgi:zinc protease